MLLKKDDALNLIESLKDQGYTSIPCDEPTKAVEGAVLTRSPDIGDESVLVQWHAFGDEEYREEIHIVDPQALANFAKQHETSNANEPKQLRIGRVFYDHAEKKAVTYRTPIRKIRGASPRIREQLEDLFETTDPGVRSEELRNLLTDSPSAE
jgi:hypothetical protein